MVDYANGVTTMYDYDADSTRLMTIQTYHGATDYQEYAYSYTDGGNIASITDAMRGHAYTYAYDDLHRLTNEAATSGSMAWTYDSIGNILSKSQDGSSMTYAYTATTHKLASVTAGGTAYNYAYDANGNITSCPKFDGASITANLTIDYNVDNMPTQVVKTVSGQPDVTTNFYYDGDGNRVRKEVVGESTTFYAGSLYEVKNGVATKYIFGADRRVAKIADGEGIQYFSKDHLGSSTVVTDASGAIVEQADYRPFGEDRFYTGTASTPTPYKYTDQELDTSTGLYNYDARHYDPAIGRFISPDSLIPNLYDPQQLNPYAYCRNNPLIYVDPTGHDFGLSTGLAVGLAMALGAYANHVSNFDDYENGKMTGKQYAGTLALGATIGGLVATQPELGAVHAAGLGVINNAANETVKDQPLDSMESLEDHVATIAGTVGGAVVGKIAKDIAAPAKTAIGKVEPVPFSNPPQFLGTVERVAQDKTKMAQAGFFGGLVGKIAKSRIAKAVKSLFSNEEGEEDTSSISDTTQESTQNSQDNSTSGEDAHDGSGGRDNGEDSNNEPTL